MPQTYIARHATEHHPELRWVADVVSGELHQGSGEPDPETGKELTNYEQILDEAKKMGATHVIYNSNGLSTPAAKEANSRIAKDPTMSGAEKAAAFTLSALAVMPKED